jgi:tetratricopeptide (TPR) repeat protein
MENKAINLNLNMNMNIDQNEGNMTHIKFNDDVNNKNNTKTIISSEEKELCIFLYTIFQYYLEKSIELMNSEDVKNKEKAKKILISLIDNSYVNYFKSNKIIYACLNGILHFYLGLSIFNTEDQYDSEDSLMKSLDFFNSLPMVVKMRYINIFQEIYNNLGILYYNKGEIKKGLQFFGKAEQMYKVFNDLNGHNITNNFNTFMRNFSKDNQNESQLVAQGIGVGNSAENLEFFNFFIDGGLNRKTFEHNYTLTIFYYAQAFTKLGFRKKAIKYCSMTLKRQIDLNEYDLKDTIINCINLSEFYTENQHFAQAEYVLIAASGLLPEDLNKKRRIRAMVHMHLGKYFLERLKFAVRQTKEQIWINESEELYSIVNKRIVTFQNMNILWPKIEDIKDIEQAKLLFRLGNTQLKKATEYYLLDGFVTEHINISRDISQLYKNLSFFESDNNRVFAMIDRRINMLESLLNEINPKRFMVQWQVKKYKYKY